MQSRAAYLKSLSDFETCLLDLSAISDDWTPTNNANFNKLLKKFLKIKLIYLVHYKISLNTFGYDNSTKAALRNFSNVTFDCLILFCHDALLPACIVKKVPVDLFREHVAMQKDRIKFAKYTKLQDWTSISALLDQGLNALKLYSNSHLRTYLKPLHMATMFLVKTVENSSLNKTLKLISDTVLFQLLKGKQTVN